MNLGTNEAPAPVAHPDMLVPLGYVGWDGLEGYLKIMGDRPGPRILYWDGTLTLMTPSPLHERRAARLDRVVQSICVELDIAYQPTGSTLFRRRDLDHGIMADRTYYIPHEELIRTVEKEIDLNLYPPPDLAIEVVVTNPATRALAISRALGIPEVWVYDASKESLAFLHLDAAGQYVPAPASRAFPFLPATEVLAWVASRENEPENRWERRLRAWVRDVLGPRRAEGA